MTEARDVLQRILDAARLDRDACAAALGLSGPVLAEMLAGQREIPASMTPLIAAVLGVQHSVLGMPGRDLRNADIVPAIWYKMRADGLADADREYVLAIRQFAFHQHELEQLTDSKAPGWKALFEELRRETDPQASPAEQGRQAARLFRRSRGLDQGASGIGEVFRGHLRNIGVLVLETSAPDSVLEGCSFYVGPAGNERPCIIANSYRTTWFRRNRILMHEMAHAIFDVESAIAALDFMADCDGRDVQEQRADAFAQEVLIPFEVLRHWAQQHGVQWPSLSSIELAQLIADTHVEQRLVVKALSDAGLVDADKADQLVSVDIAEALRQRSAHALSTEEFVRSGGAQPAGWLKRRTTTLTPRKLLLPVRYVMAVWAAYSDALISRGKAARMLMIDEVEFQERFADDTPCEV